MKDIIDLEEKRIEKEYKETGVIKCNLPFELGSDEMNNPKRSFWQKLKGLFK